MDPGRRRTWPRSLQGQVLFWLALALLFAQGLSAGLIYRAQDQRREAAMINAAAVRLTGNPRERAGRGDAPVPASRILGRENRRMGVEISPTSPLRDSETRLADAERTLGEILSGEGVAYTELVVVERRVAGDPLARQWLAMHPRHSPFASTEPPERMLLAGVHDPDGTWHTARIFVPGGQRRLVGSLLAQTLFIYIVLVGAMALLLRRITRPLAALTTRVERFSAERDGRGQVEPSGPDDVRRLIAAHNAMENRIIGLLDEKDVMLGAIGHDLKTPLAALRVRIESVENDAERGKMAAGIEDINRSLDDILSLARVGRPSDDPESTELSALAGAVVEEYEDMGEPVTCAESPRIVVRARATWLRRALRNLIDNGLRYGGSARLALGREPGFATIRIDDDGPGIPDDQIARMLEPFTRLEASRNSSTGGAGLGLTLARAVAEQHGGTLELANRRAGGRIAGLTATLRIPL
ncbi:ATP-binding protein [Novosphingobium tardum]|uniref:histidine kinase n=1 Tax=Novosphingobium tardum TaxID=1538021 RepID=A0ABV8RLM3_9SPHN